jgi:hypothetical protein
MAYRTMDERAPRPVREERDVMAFIRAAYGFSAVASTRTIDIRPLAHRARSEIRSPRSIASPIINRFWNGKHASPLHPPVSRRLQCIFYVLPVVAVRHQEHDPRRSTSCPGE